MSTADSHRPTELPSELPDENPPLGPSMFDLPDEGDLMGPGLRGPVFELPDDPPPPAAAVPTPNSQLSIAGEVLPAKAGNAISELLITPDVETYLTQLEAAIKPYEAAALDFARQMQEAPVTTPEQLAYLGQQSLVAKEREQLLDALFEPAIRRPRTYLDRVYALKRRVVQAVKTGGETAARRYMTRKRELEEADRKARLAAERRAKEAEQAAERVAAAERYRLGQQAVQASQEGNLAAVADLIEQARAVEPVPVAVELPPVMQAPAAAVAGMGERLGWEGAIVDMLTAILAAARPHLFREVATLIEAGELTAGGTSLTTQMIAGKLRLHAQEMPMIPATVFAGDAAELKRRATADRDTLQWPGFEFKQTVTPVRRPGARTKGAT